MERRVIVGEGERDDPREITFECLLISCICCWQEERYCASSCLLGSAETGSGSNVGGVHIRAFRLVSSPRIASR